MTNLSLRPLLRIPTAVMVAISFILLAGCTSGASPAVPDGSTSVAAATINVTISGGNVDPNGKKIDLKRGQTVVVNVTSDITDEVHAHTGGDGYRIEVAPGQPARGEFVVVDRGSFALESHHLKKIIAILNVR